jgi:hypothetical protein
MKTSRILRRLRSWLLALVLGGAFLFAPAAVHATSPMVRMETPVVPAVWYNEILNSRSRTIQVVFIAVLLGAFMLRRTN